jgi:acetyl-CoA acetyltransferase
VQTLIAGVGMTPFGRFPDRSMKDLSANAVREAMDDAEVEIKEIQAVFFSNALAGLITGQECIRGEVLTFELGFDNVPVINVENACASAGTALHQACRSIAAEEWDCVLAVGVEKMYDDADRTKSLRALRGAMDVDALDVNRTPADRSPFIDLYASRARKLIEERGVTPQGLAEVASKAWMNGAGNPKAQRQEPMKAEQILASRIVVEPLTIGMCALIGDGAAAAIVTSRKGDCSRAVPIRASQLRTLSARRTGRTATQATAAAVYEEAGVGPEDISVAEVHDATAVGEMMSWVDSGLCQSGREEAWAMDGHTLRSGRLPVNPSGGLLARGHPLGASGLAQIYELVRQLRGEAGSRQIARPQIALAQIGGGAIDGRTAVSAIHIMERPGSASRS